MIAMYDWANLWSTSIDVLGDACNAARGLHCPKETCKRWTGGKSLWGMVFQTHEDARHEIFRTLSSDKTETRSREHSECLSPISKFGAMMTGFYSKNDFPSNV